MNNNKVWLNTIVVSFVTSVFLALPAHAALYTYSYTGNNFTTYASPYLSTDRVEMQFTIELASNLDLAWQDRTSDVVSFQAYDGHKLTTNANVEFLTVAFSTDNTGAIGDWTFHTGRPAGVISTHNAQDFASLIFSETNTPLAYVDAQPGSWTVSQVPLPASIVFFVSGLMALVSKSALRKFKDSRH
ncbi:MAG: hypothetical protein AB1560_11685 [Pseudomonadota bacterium]